MERYDYVKAMTEDIYQWLQDNDFNYPADEDEDDIIESIVDDVWGEDSITGNGAYGYDTKEKCEEYLCHNWDLAIEASREFDMDLSDFIAKSDANHFIQQLDSLVRLQLAPIAATYALDKWKIEHGIPLEDK